MSSTEVWRCGGVEKSQDGKLSDLKVPQNSIHHGIHVC